jgi:hypothetical protein
MSVYDTAGRTIEASAGEFFTVSIHQSEVERIAQWVADYPDCETGGNLFGFWTHVGSPAVQLTLGPGPRADHQVAAFFQDVDHLQTQGRKAQELYGLQHIGDWHSHHRLGLAEPSSGDVSTTRRTLENNGFDRFVIFIANIGGDNGGGRWRRQRDSGGHVRLNAFLFERGRPTFRRGRFLVLPDESPTAHSAAQRGISEPLPPGSVSIQLPLATQAPGRSAPRIQGWYSRPDGTDFLRAVDAACRAQFTDCRILVTADHGLLRYEFATRAANWALVFPADFPEEPVELLREDQPVKPIVTGPSSSSGDFSRQVFELVRVTESGPPADAETPPVEGGPGDDVE